MSNINISVVIPVFNREKELEAALSALVAQTSDNFEVIVVDDGSTKDLSAIIEKFKPLLELTYLKIENSGGPARPRNIGISHAKGRWISFLDSDDGWFPRRIEAINTHLSDDADVVYHQLAIILDTDADRSHSSARQKFMGRSIGRDPLVDMLLKGNPVPNSAALIRRSFLDKIGPLSEVSELRTVEDFDLWLRAAEEGGRFKYIDQCLGWYSVGRGNISSGAYKQIEMRDNLMKKHMALLPASLREAARRHHAYIIGIFAMKAGDLSLANRSLRDALPLSTLTLNMKCLVRWLQTKYLMSRCS